MKTFQVNLRERSYPILLESGLINRIHSILAERNNGQKWVIISQYRLMELIGFKLKEKLEKSEFDCDFITVPASESAKSLNEFSRIISQMIEMGCDRSSIILSLGGGVVGDVAGFVASTFMRGIRYFQIPTTLLAMVDSSIGGKTGINIAEGKNLVGSIYQPLGIFIDPEILVSLPMEDVVSGLGEVVKYGAIQNKKFLNNISSWLDDLDSFPFEKAIAQCCKIKAEIVSKDERDGSLRQILNFGHTIGHALEAHLGYGKIRHGEAVAYGMLCAGSISVKIGSFSSEDNDKLRYIIKKLPLPKLSFIDSDLLMPFIKTDKKFEQGHIRFVVLDGLGNAKTTLDVSHDLIMQSIKVLH